jgi:hypothetical protein
MNCGVPEMAAGKSNQFKVLPNLGPAATLPPVLQPGPFIQPLDMPAKQSAAPAPQAETIPVRAPVVSPPIPTAPMEVVPQAAPNQPNRLFNGGVLKGLFNGRSREAGEPTSNVQPATMAAPQERTVAPLPTISSTDQPILGAPPSATNVPPSVTTVTYAPPGRN